MGLRSLCLVQYGCSIMPDPGMSFKSWRRRQWLREMVRALTPFAMMNPHTPPRDVDPAQWARDIETARTIIAETTEHYLA